MRPAPAALCLLALAACSDEPIAPGPPPMAEVGPPGDFSDTGALPCSADEPTFDETCYFGVTRGAGGAVALQVVNPAAEPEGIQRILVLQNGAWTTVDGSIAEAERTAEATRIAVDDIEFYAVPHDVLTSG